MDMSPFAFRECAVCEDKPGTPGLCPSCLHNRNAIGELQTRVRTLHVALGLADAAVDALLTLAVNWRKALRDPGGDS